VIRHYQPGGGGRKFDVKEISSLPPRWRHPAIVKDSIILRLPTATFCDFSSRDTAR